MPAPAEITLNVPVEIDGERCDRLAVASFEAIANFRTNSPEQVIRSLAKVYAVPRKVIRHLAPSDAQRAGDLVAALLDDTTRSFR
ncbi:phage tail assembly protein [Bradyrhizobium guangdongense]|uniref:Phage tail assembly protein n=1 Tax=Bradyrhizobium guangdongense TaxID=1325090 RepID=A0AA87WDA5_9BRAD|nr:phage tail assembly protein [Bradyrhizobium guangdongense]QOZ62560.1 hypothetical protein XH86_30300 [Bradyrhizobium guangdongense]GGI31716.1 hypothetical protein GCM10010987_65800 [Bradyrhizobium guangdongense]